MERVFELLDALGVPYETFEHPAVFTVEEAEKHRPPREFWENKNLFLRNKKGDKHFLVTLSAKKQLDLKKIGNELGERISFASPERLKKHLTLTPGSVSPFGLIHNVERDIIFILDKDVFLHENIGVHPNTNTQTVVLKTKDFIEVVKTLTDDVRIQEM